MCDQSSHHRESAAIAEPVQLQLYGFWTTRLPSYVVAQSACILGLILLIVAAGELMTPRTELGVEITRFLEEVPPLQKCVIWLRPLMLFGIGFEAIEAVIVIGMFHRKRQQTQAQQPAIDGEDRSHFLLGSDPSLPGEHHT